MKLNRLFLTISLILGFNYALYAATIQGEVTHAQSGESISNATITAFPADSSNPSNGDSLVYTAFTGGDGTYSLQNIPAGVYNLSCDHSEYYSESRGVTLENDQTIKEENFSLNSVVQQNYDNLLAGAVFDQETSSPVSNANICLSGNGGGGDNPSGDSCFAYCTYSDREGKYRFENVEPGSYQLSADADGYQDYVSNEIIEITETSIIENQDIYLIPAPPDTGYAVLLGYVWSTGTNHNQGDSVWQEPVYPATIEVIGMHPSTGDSLFYTTTNNPDGSYRIENIMPETYTISCRAEEYETVYYHDYRLVSGDNQLSFYLASGSPTEYGSISGNVVYDDNNEPVAWALIEFIPTNGNWGYSYSTYTNEQGIYSDDVPAGDYYVSCSYNNFGGGDLGNNDTLYYSYQEYYDDVHSISEATVVSVMANNSTENINFGIPQFSTENNVTISGTVKDNQNQPIEGALVNLWVLNGPMWGDSLAFYGYSDAQGNYSITINNSEYQLYSVIASAEKDGFLIEFYNEKPEFYLADEIYIYGLTDVRGIDFTLDPVSGTYENSISGNVTSDNGQALPNAFIIGANSSTGQLVITFSDDNGDYLFDNLTTGNYYLIFTAGGHFPEFYDDALIWEDATAIPVNGAVTSINASLTPIVRDSSNGVITGTISNPNSDPLSGVLVTAKDALGNAIGYDFTESNGSYQIMGVGGGSYTVQASKIQYNSEAESINSNPQTTTLLNFNMSEASTAVDEKDIVPLPKELFLGRNYPNPFNPSTSIAFSLPQAQHVKIIVYNVLGQMVKELTNEMFQAGHYNVTWDGCDFKGNRSASGIYILALETTNNKLFRKMTLIK